jgi:TolA-binding protein
MYRQSSTLVALIVTVLSSLILAPSGMASDEDQMREREEKLEELRKRKAEIEAKAREAMKEMRQEPHDRSGSDEVIDGLEELYANCRRTKTPKCAEVTYGLARQYYCRARDKYIAERARYEKEMDAWEKNPDCFEPENPRLDYSKALELYEEAAIFYPNHERIDEAYYQIGTIYMVQGDFDKSKKVMRYLREKYPMNPSRTEIRLHMHSDSMASQSEPYHEP